MVNGGTQVEADQPGLGGEWVGQYLNSSKGTQAVAFTYGPAGTTDSLAAQQLYARDLYTLMMAMADTKALAARLGSAAACNRLIAQWAVNCVAYRDHNSIMIPFTYDGQNTVWGCKRPDLIIAETLAFHDRRTEDLNDEVVDPAKPNADPTRNKPGLTTDTDPKVHDPGFNQKYRPKGSLFVKLYMPWTAMEAQSRDLSSALRRTRPTASC